MDKEYLIKFYHHLNVTIEMMNELKKEKSWKKCQDDEDTEEIGLSLDKLKMLTSWLLFFTLENELKKCRKRLRVK